MKFQLDLGEHTTRDGTVVHIENEDNITQGDPYHWAGWYVEDGEFYSNHWSDNGGYDSTDHRLDILPPEETYWMPSIRGGICFAKYVTLDALLHSDIWTNATHHIQFAIRDGVPEIVQIVGVE